MKRSIWIIVSIIGLLFLDGVSKWYFSGIFQGQVFGPDALFEYYPIYKNFFGIQLSYNSGIAFSLPIEGHFLHAMSILFTGGIFLTYIIAGFQKEKWCIDIGWLLLFSGALAHTYERIAYGKVIDFISVKYFAIFNFADILISMGGLLLVCYFLFYDGKQ